MFALNHGPNDKVGHEALIPSVKSQIAIGFLTGPLSTVVMCLTADPEVASSIPVWSRSDVHATLCEIKIDDLKKHLIRTSLTEFSGSAHGTQLIYLSYLHYNMGRDARKPVFGISDKVRFKPVCSATERLARKLKFRLLQV